MAIQFIPLPETQFALDVSGDGTTVVGNAFTPSMGYHGFRWTINHGYEIIDGLHDAAAVSFDGSRIAGTDNIQFQPAVWTIGGGVQVIQGFHDNFSRSARGISADGSIVVGYSNSTFLSFRWDGSTLDEYSNGYFSMPNSANAISEDGKTIVGSDHNSAYKWTRESGIVSLAPLSSNSAAWAVSADGSVIVQRAYDRAFRWTQANSLQSLGDLPGGSSGSWAFDMTADASTVVGFATTAKGSEAFI